MGKRQRERLERERIQKRKRLIIAAISVAIIVCITIGIVLFVVLNTVKVETISAGKSFDGSLSIPIDALSTDLQYIDYGYEQNLLAIIDSDGVVRTAYNTCFECYSTGDAHYTLRGKDTLVCSACGNTYSISILGTNNWGGCQPVSIPPEYRQDSDKAIVLSNKLLAFVEEMFKQWNDEVYDMSLENYEI